MMEEGGEFFQVVSLPDKPIDKNIFLEIIGTDRFLLIYDLQRRVSVLSISKARAAQLASALPGLELEAFEQEAFDTGKCATFSVYRRLEETDKPMFSDLFDLQIKSGKVAIEFVPVRMEGAKEGKSYLESVLSKREAGQTNSFLSGVINKRANTAIHTENFKDSEEQLFLTETIESLNASILKNGISYKIYFLVEGDDAEDYINKRFLVFSKRGPGAPKPKALPFGASIAKTFLNFYGAKRVNYVLQTASAQTTGNIEVGTCMKDSVFDTMEPVLVEATSLNLGTIVTGLPGSGKTSEAMALLDEISGNKATKICVISPTNEWNPFAASHGFNNITLYDGKTPINFFRCPDNSNVEKFYEDLAMVLSSASNAGPYRNPMEKCMLNAFRKIYKETREPDPVELYELISKSIASFHARSTATGYKYTKHGENIKSALENLRAILSRPEYSSKEGVSFTELLEKGVVFDLSRVSNSSKPYLYALILNQLYSIASTFDTNGDNELRMLICVEESQIIFKEKESTAIQDIRSRIQDFRKLGVGLMLLAHNVTDIEPTVRRLCQTKLYLKQAPDVAQVAAKELVFTYANEEEVTQRLKHLDSRIGAFSYIERRGSEKIAKDTVFIRTKEYKNKPNLNGAASPNIEIDPVQVDSAVAIEAILSDIEEQRDVILNMRRLRLLFLGEIVAEEDMVKGAFPKVKGLLKGREYMVELLDKRSRVIYSTKAAADDVMRVSIG